MWFGTNGGGLCSFSKETETFVDFDPENVWLPDKVIYSIEQDRQAIFGFPVIPGYISLILQIRIRTGFLL